MTNAEARFNKSLRPRKPEGSLGRTAQDVHLDSHTAPELSLPGCRLTALYRDPRVVREGGEVEYGGGGGGGGGGLKIKANNKNKNYAGLLAFDHIQQQMC